MIRRPPDSTRPDTLFPYTTLFRAVSGADASVRSIEDMPRDYLHEIRQVQARGPYRLAGGSMAGLVAFAISHQIPDAGDAVELLALFDPHAPKIGRPSWRERVFLYLSFS